MNIYSQLLQHASVFMRPSVAILLILTADVSSHRSQVILNFSAEDSPQILTSYIYRVPPRGRLCAFQRIPINLLDLGLRRYSTHVLNLASTLIGHSIDHSREASITTVERFGTSLYDISSDAYLKPVRSIQCAVADLQSKVSLR